MSSPAKSVWIIVAVLITMLCGQAAMATEKESEHTHYLRLGGQWGTVLESNDFVAGDNASGEKIDEYQSLRLEFGWQTDGNEDWHHLYNFPSYGIGIYSCEYANGDELGNPTSLYGFFSWPAKRWSRSSLNVDFAFGLTDNWVGFDPETNPYNTAMGAGSSVIIDFGANFEFPLSRRFWLQAGFTATHFSNGGSQQPNFGINQVGGIAYVKYDLQERNIPSQTRPLAPFTPSWEMNLTFMGGGRNLALDLRDQTDDLSAYYTKDYFVGNMVFMTSKQFGRMSKYTFGLDVGYDESVSDRAIVDGLINETNPEEIDFIDKFSLGGVAGYEHVVHRASLIVHLGYTFFQKTLPNSLPRFYQRLGLRYHFWQDLYAGLNVRFHEFSRADNLEFNVGYRWTP